MNVIICESGNRRRTVVLVDDRVVADSKRAPLLHDTAELVDVYTRLGANVTVATLPTSIRENWKTMRELGHVSA